MSDAKKRKSKIKSRGKMPPEIKQRWLKSLEGADADREIIQAQGRAVLAAQRTARAVVERLKEARKQQGLSLADMLERTGMTREALSRLETNDSPNPTVRTLARYAAAVGLELHMTATPR